MSDIEARQWTKTFRNMSLRNMSLRDWFAGQALAGILAGPCSREGVPVSEWLDTPHEAYKIADAMLQEREES